MESNKLTSPEELDVLPISTIVRDVYGDDWRKISDQYWEWLVDEDAHSRMSHEIHLPVTVVTK